LLHRFHYDGGVRTLFATMLLAVAACQGAPPAAQKEKSAPAGPVEIEPAPAAGEVAPAVAARLSATRTRGRTLLVYVGATWCEPCQRLHEAARSGALDALFPGLTLLEFDLDRDGDRLEQAGYQSKYVPLLVRPLADGRASEARTEGVKSGSDAIADLTPRLQALLAAP
jgi:thiol-disulfide isomerase/thioredoxin